MGQVELSNIEKGIADVEGQLTPWQQMGSRTREMAAAGIASSIPFAGQNHIHLSNRG